MSQSSGTVEAVDGIDTADGVAGDESDESRLDRLLLLASDWATRRHLTDDDLVQLLDEVDLPARLYGRAISALDEAGYTVDVSDDTTEDSEASDDGGGWNVDGLSTFMRQSRHDVLSATQEVELGRRIEAGRLAEHALATTLGLPEDVRADLERVAHDGRAAFEVFARHNIRLVIHLASRAKGRSSAALDFEDLIQEGYIGLTRALEKWDCTRGLKFSTYATWWIRQSLSRALADKGETIRLPVYAAEMLRKILRTEQQLLQSNITPTVKRLAERTGVPQAKVRELLSWRNRVDSLHRLIGDGDAELHELLAADSSSEREHLALQRVLAETVDELLSQLRPQEAEIVRRRFGLDGRTPETLEEIGRSFGVTRERIRQIEARAIEKLKHPLRTQRLRAFVEAD
jgi:RNA polymerase primary sigma factor